MNRPVLYHDIDGVLFGCYGPNNRLQLRPYSADWIAFAGEHFDIHWLTAWSLESVQELVTQTYLNCYLKSTSHSYINWTESFLSKLDYILYSHKIGVTNWYWIDDESLSEKEITELDNIGCATRYISVPYYGQDTLLLLIDKFTRIVTQKIEE